MSDLAVVTKFPSWAFWILNSISLQYHDGTICSNEMRRNTDSFLKITFGIRKLISRVARFSFKRERKTKHQNTCVLHIYVCIYIHLQLHSFSDNRFEYLSLILYYMIDINFTYLGRHWKVFVALIVRLSNIAIITITLFFKSIVMLLFINEIVWDPSEGKDEVAWRREWNEWVLYPLRSLLVEGKGELIQLSESGKVNGRKSNERRQWGHCEPRARRSPCWPV